MTPTEPTEPTTPWHKRPFACFDTESTGVDTDTARLVTADVIRLDPTTDQVTDHRSYLADPGVEIPAEASDIHGVTTERARAEGLPVAEVLLLVADDIERAWAEGLPVVAFNAAYDLTLLDREMRRHHNRPFPVVGPVLDPYVIDRRMDRYRKGKRQLALVCEHYGITLEHAHTSDADALAAGRVMVALVRKYPSMIGRRDLRSLWSCQRAWHRTWAANFEVYMRRVTKDNADKAWWDTHGHYYPCATWAADDAPCACGDARDGSGDTAAAAVHIDGSWPQRPYTDAQSEAA